MKNGRQVSSGGCHKHFYQSQHCAQPPDISFIPRMSIRTKKFTCQLGSECSTVHECALSGLDFFIWQMVTGSKHAQKTQIGTGCRVKIHNNFNVCEFILYSCLSYCTCPPILYLLLIVRRMRWLMHGSDNLYVSFFQQI